MQMAVSTMLIDAAHAAFENRKETFDGACSGVAPC
jgi:hypothetical protein